MSFLTYAYRKTFVAFLRFTSPHPISDPDDVLQIPSRNLRRTIKAHVYRPSAAAPQKPSPVLVNMHGSGFVLPLHGSDEEYCRWITQRTEYTVLDVQYSLGPEKPYPAAPNDVEDVVKFVLAHPEDYDASRFSISGFSAGGNLALSISSSTKFPKGTFHSVIAYYPPTDFSIPPEKKAAPDTTGKPIPPFMCNLFDYSYLMDHDPGDPEVSPALRAASSFPERILIVTCACDTLAADGEKLANKIEQAGGRHVVKRRIEKANHGWDKTTKEGTEGRKTRDEAYDLAVEMLNR